MARYHFIRFSGDQSARARRNARAACLERSPPVRGASGGSSRASDRRRADEPAGASIGPNWKGRSGGSGTSARRISALSDAGSGSGRASFSALTAEGPGIAAPATGLAQARSCRRHPRPSRADLRACHRAAPVCRRSASSPPDADCRCLARTRGRYSPTRMRAVPSPRNARASATRCDTSMTRPP